VREKELKAHIFTIPIYIKYHAIFVLKLDVAWFSETLVS
jgi:hypothetical protein